MICPSLGSNSRTISCNRVKMGFLPVVARFPQKMGDTASKTKNILFLGLRSALDRHGPDAAVTSSLHAPHPTGLACADGVMAATELSSPLIGGQAGVANAWGGAEIKGEAFATFTAQADHGVNLQVGLGALVGLDASFSKFISASVQGQANAALNATFQIQVPMNLFQEVGAAVRLRISAEAAAGVTLQLGLSVGDFLSLVEGQVGADSLEAHLFGVFLDEVTIGGGACTPRRPPRRWRTPHSSWPAAPSRD